MAHVEPGLDNEELHGENAELHGENAELHLENAELHFPNEKYKKLPKTHAYKIFNTEFKESTRDACARIELSFSEMPQRFFSKCPFAYLVVSVQKLLALAGISISAEIVSVSMSFETPTVDKKYTSGERGNIFEILVGPRKLLNDAGPMKSAYRYEVDFKICETYLVGIRAPLRYSVSRFKELIRRVKVSVLVQLRKIRCVKLSADHMCFRAAALPEKMWMRFYLIKESNVALQKLIESMHSDEEILAKVADGALCAYHDMQTMKLSDAISVIMSAIFAPRGFAFESSIAPTSTLTEKYVYYTQEMGAPIKRCGSDNSVASPFDKDKLCDIAVVKYLGAGHWGFSNNVSCSYNSANGCPISYFCDGAFPFSQFTFQHRLIFN